ncbi:MAG: ATP-binding protein [Methylocystis sp.]|uniref:sensor histidine kinase n=1 Tax=Methylocystis sp. TaxID=1911079 RepID=UPI003D10D88C
MRTTTKTSRIAVLVAEFVTLAAMSVAIVFLVQRSQAAARLEANALELQNQLFKVRHLLHRSDGALRGFLLTGQQPTLNAHLSDKRSLTAALKELLSASELDDEIGQTAARPLQEAIAKLDGQWEDIYAAYNAREKRAPTDLIVKEQATLTESVRPIFDTLEQQSQALVERRTAASIEFQRDLLVTSVAGSALIIGVAGAALLLMHQREMELQRLQRQLEATNANLESLVEQRTGHVREVNEEIQRFAYIVSHDLRAPLVNIMGFTSELESLRPSLFEATHEGLSREQNSADADERARDFDEALRFIKLSTSKMDRLINAILQLSREGQRMLRPERIDMNELFRTITEAVAHQAREAGATITIAPVPDVTSDRLSLEQIFLNLVDNALKYLRPSVQGEIALSATETPTIIVYKVKDNGQGVDEKDKERIFDLFRRAGNQETPGEGIGLAHTRALARRLGGSISIQSTPGMGSEFSVALPKFWPHSE